MPYIDLRVHPAPNAEQAADLTRGITDAMVEVVHKRRELTAVRLAADSTRWTIGGETCRETTAACLDVRITAGTNAREEKAALIKRPHRVLVDTLGTLAEASYIVVHELPAESWDYTGRTQAACAGVRS